MAYPSEEQGNWLTQLNKQWHKEEENTPEKTTI